jgi:hypothetical protein
MVDAARRRDVESLIMVVSCSGNDDRVSTTRAGSPRPDGATDESSVPLCEVARFWSP